MRLLSAPPVWVDSSYRRLRSGSPTTAGRLCPEPGVGRRKLGPGRPVQPGVGAWPDALMGWRRSR